MNPPCTLLPINEQPLTAADITALGDDRSPKFYETSLRFAQTLWQSGLPGQALLQLNRALSCVFDNAEPILAAHPLPYRVVAWILQNRPADQFIGNPRRHWQHLATRMVEPNKALRTWRAWACWHLANTLLPIDDFPPDARQLHNEGIIEPTFHQISQQLGAHSPMQDKSIWHAALLETHITIEQIGPDKLSIIRDLAHRIWPRVYPGIISIEQIQFMLHQRYEIDVLSSDTQQKGARYALIHQRQLPIGYIHIEPRLAQREVFLQKLYLLPEHAGQGIGSMALNWAADQARALDATHVRLLVNKRNTNAIRAYLHAGFVVEQDIVTDIGNGFVMDDYQMVWRL